MIKMKQALLKEIVATYKKYDWNLKEILFRKGNDPDPGQELSENFEEATIREAEIDAAWFSRPSKHKRQAWELRIVAEQPLALFETFPNDIDKAQLDRNRNEMETRLADMTSKK